MILRSNYLSSLVKVGAGAIVLNLGRLVVVLISARYVKPHDLGIYFLIMAASGVITTIAGFGTNTALVKFMIEEEKNENKLSIATTAITFFLLSLISVIIISIIFTMIFRIFEVRPIYVYLSISYALFFYLNYILQGLNKFKAISIANSLNGISKISVAIVLIAIVNTGFEGLIWTITLSNIVGIVFQIYHIHNGFVVRPVILLDPDILKNILKFSLPIYCNQIYSIFYNRGYTILIAAMLNPTAVAYYNIATRISLFIDQMRQVYISVYFPKLTELLKTNKEKANNLLTISITFIFNIIAIGSLSFYLFKSHIIILLFSQEYETAAMASFIMLALCSQSFCASIMGFSLVALGHNSAPMRINFIITTFSFLTSYLLIPHFGYMGVVYVAFVCSILGFTLNLLYLLYVRFIPKLNRSTWIAFVAFILLVILILVNSLLYYKVIAVIIFFAFCAPSLYSCRKYIN